MSPAPGEMLLRYVGDRIRFSIRSDKAAPQAFLRTNFGRGSFLHAEVVQEYGEELARWGAPTPPSAAHNLPSGMAWRDIAMRPGPGEWIAEITLTEVGFFNAKAYLVDERGRQVWPGGSDIGITVHPSEYRTANIIYCAFTRMFGETKTALSTTPKVDPAIERLDRAQYAVIPPSGKLRDLIAEFPHIFQTLGCRILHLLPVNPTPTTYARFGRFGSPYACEDLTAIDPALVEFDRRSTGIEQFQELTYAAHLHGGRVFLDIVINHTGWGSTLQENHPEWFLRKEDGHFESPGAWGTTWEDLVELDHRMPHSWDYLADVFITWCRRGVDGFRCDAGYKVPTVAWRYITAKVRHEFPDAVFLLEGLGGAWEATEDLLTRGGMQWAYSELFQNHSPLQVSGYFDHSALKSETVGTLVHYSETHDNERLASRGRAWSLLRNQLCALASHSGGFGYTCGVEWLAAERVNVHSSRALAWNNPANLIPELARLSVLLRHHPGFFDGATTRRISGADSTIFAFIRTASSSAARLLILANLDLEQPGNFFLPQELFQELGAPDFDLLTETRIPVHVRADTVELPLQPGQSLCLAPHAQPLSLGGSQYRLLRARHAWAINALASILEPENLGPHSWTALAEWVEADVQRFLASLAVLSPDEARLDLMAALQAAAALDSYPAVVPWDLSDARKITPIPPRHWLLITDLAPFRATLSFTLQQHCESVPLQGRHVAVFPPLDAFRRPRRGRATLEIERYSGARQVTRASVLYLNDRPGFSLQSVLPIREKHASSQSALALLANGRGGMARLCVDLGAIKSKYDCVLGANLHPALPVDRHVLVKRIRVWANADRFIKPLNAGNLQSFDAGPPARWEFAAIAGDGQFARVELVADMLDQRNTVVFSFRLLDTSKPSAALSLTIRFDVEDRNFHSETHHNGDADHHFSSHTHLLSDQPGFDFQPASDRHVRIYATSGLFHHAPEWSTHIAHPVEQTRGQTGAGDGYSPGWFEISLQREVPVYVVVDAEPSALAPEALRHFATERAAANAAAQAQAGLEDAFGRQLALATRAYVVRRDEAKSVIAGYPWFLDWGRDSLICARGLISAGMLDEVRDLLVTFGRFEQDGTLPNTIHGADASNRDTSDAPLWYGVVAEELAALQGNAIYATKVDLAGRTIADVLRAIAVGCIRSTPNRIHLDPASGLIWSPSHFTWMDTNYPAGTPREGYPIEIQALWIRLLEQLARLDLPPHEQPWGQRAQLARASLLQYFWLEEKGWFADVLLAPYREPARRAIADDALRSNCVIPITFDLVPRPQARRCLANVLRYLVIPGALRSLAPLPVQPPLPIHGSDWRLLNNPREPYWGRYEGDEDTQRKPAYHNGTAWTWTFPGLCEAIARAWNFSPLAVEAARAYLGSMEILLEQGCLGHIPEVLDGDAPHIQRGCDAQAWGATEALRVWKLLSRM